MTTGTLNPVKALQGENIRLKNELRDMREENYLLRKAFESLLTLQEVSSSIDASTDVLHLVDRILASSLASIGANDGSLILVDEESNELSFVVVHGQARDKLMGYRMPMGTGIAGWVAENGESVIVPNVNLDPRFSHRVDEEFQFRTLSILCVPMIFNGRVLGVIQAINKTNQREFNDLDLLLFKVVAQLAALSIARAEEILAEEV
ncbi:MAG: GAF domain-containing protein [Chloroflexi bacterium]|nr:GAF domain-containing protein [Chloroflexota bacterium]